MPTFRCQETGRIFGDDEVWKTIKVVMGNDSRNNPVIVRQYLHEGCDCHAVKIADGDFCPIKPKPEDKWVDPG